MFRSYPSSSPALATAFATKLINHFIDSVKQLYNAAVSAQTQQQLLQTITGINKRQCFQFSNITSNDMYHAIHELPLPSSHGIDNSTSKMLRYFSSILSPCIAQLFNACFHHCRGFFRYINTLMPFLLPYLYSLECRTIASLGPYSSTSLFIH